ncbi:Tryptophan synthase alpha chain [Labilithrix luteola]|uniref:Tryptophan synthase alpha chain n=1 Tax=Labilithrix luteola TaxID=1391654 RepID=A0A0K1PXY7_9BACT|nr:Tryptophan synthase alpha chain [Labilithrix luteola]
MGLLVATSACSLASDHDRGTSTSPTCPSAASCSECNGDACSGANGGIAGATGGSSGKNSSGGTSENGPEASDGIKDGSETDVDCGGTAAPKCAEGKACLVDDDCEVACGHAKRCVSAPSCTIQLGGDTCGIGELGSAGVQHESCCRPLPVSGYADPAHPGKTVYVDKYEITAGRIRNWVARLATERAGKPDVAGWIKDHTPVVWDHAWDKFLPSSTEGPSVVIARRLLGDPRPEDNGESGPPGPGVILPPCDGRAAQPRDELPIRLVDLRRPPR